MKKKIENFQKHSEISKKKKINHPRAINWENLYMYFEGKIISFIIAEGRGGERLREKLGGIRKKRTVVPLFPQAIIEQEKDEN